MASSSSSSPPSKLKEQQNELRDSARDIFGLEEFPEEDSNTCTPERPWKCLWRVAMDAVVIVGVYGLLTLLIEERVPRIDALLTFLSLFVPIGFGLHMMKLDYADQLVRVAGFQLGTKIFTTLTT
jgi:hypothetical protein